MAPTRPAAAASSAARRLAYRLAIPAGALLLFAVLGLLWHWGPHALYFDVLTFFGFEPFRFPFLDIHAVLAAAQCQRQGVDVYLANPCDVLGRVHVYSPLWLAIEPGFLGIAATTPVGLGIDLLFILSLAMLIRPATRGELLVLALAALSPMTVYALERANSDVIVFLLILSGCALDRAPRPWRLGCYALYLFAGLLKYYPLVLLVLVARERQREAFAAAVLALLALLGFAGVEHADLAKALANIPALSYFADSFSAQNLPFGIVAAVSGARSSRLAGVFLLSLFLLSLLAALAIARTWRTLRLLDPAGFDWSSCEARCLPVGALLVTACFFAAQNVNYRGIYFLLAMPGLVRLYRCAGEPAIRRFLAQMIAAVLFVAWDDALRRAARPIAAMIANDWWRLRIELLFWVGCELAWWWLIAGLAALVLNYLVQVPRFGCSRATLGLLQPTGGGSANNRPLGVAGRE
jgi:hypothetical protein